MNYKCEKDCIKIFGKEDFVPSHILECGQVFSYQKNGDVWQVFAQDKMAEIEESETGYVIKTSDPKYFENFFDLKTDYALIKKQLLKFDIMKEPIEFGHGIRILKQNLFEMLLSFIISQNNNIKRIQLILNRIREKFGKNMGGFYAFPTREELLTATQQDFASLGAGYRDKYLFNVLRQVSEKDLEEWKNLDTKTLRQKLIALSGVGPKVADCVLLFGYGRGDVFPVDTWIEKMYNRFYAPLSNREQIRNNFVGQFAELSGYAQQYLFYYIRERGASEFFAGRAE